MLTAIGMLTWQLTAIGKALEDNTVLRILDLSLNRFCLFFITLKPRVE